MTTAPPVRAVRAAALAMLRAAASLPGTSEQRIGDGKAPADVTTPYGVVWPATAVDHDGPVPDRSADCDVLVQLTAVGATPDEAEGLADAALAVWLQRSAWAITGRALREDPSVETYRPLPRDDQLGATSRFNTVVVVRIPTTPA